MKSNQLLSSLKFATSPGHHQRTNLSASMFSPTLGIFLIGLTATAHCFVDQSELDVPVRLDRQGRTLRLKGWNVFDVLKKLDICYLQCKKGYCECCQKIKILLVKIEVCGTADFTPAEKIAQVGLKISGLKVLSTKVKLERHVCRPISSKIGPVELCIDSKVLENGDNANSFPVCFKIQISYEGIPSALLTLGCSDENVANKEQGAGEFHSISTLKVLNGDQVAKAIQKIAAAGSGKKLRRN